MKYENGYKHTIGYRDDKMHRDAKNDIVLTTVGLNIRIGQRLIREGNTKLAEFLGVSYVYLDNIRYGENTFPIRQGINICQYMRLTPNSILDIEDHFMESDSRPEYTNYKYTDKDIGERVSFFRFCSNLSLEQLSQRVFFQFFCQGAKADFPQISIPEIIMDHLSIYKSIANISFITDLQ